MINVLLHAEGKILRSKQIQSFNPEVARFTPLILVMPDHGNVGYEWEKKGTSEWEAICVPRDTCILYVKSCGLYKCTVMGQEYQFDVRGIYLHYYIFPIVF